MATTYTNELKEIVFLNNKNIAQKQEDLDTISYNAIPSLSLFNSTYSELTGKSNDIEISAYGISCQVNAICGQISDEIKFQAENAKSYTEQLSAEFETISGDLRGTVTVIDRNHLAGEHELSVRKLTNEQYNSLVADGLTVWNELYVIDDSYHDMRGQKIKNLADPYELSDAANKQYVDSTEKALSDLTLAYAANYSNQTSANAEIAAKTYSDRTFAKYNGLEFSYNSNEHYLSVGLTNAEGITFIKSIDTTDFIKNRIVQSITINGDKLQIAYEKPGGSSEIVEIPLNKLVNVYEGVHGISIGQDQRGFVISCDDTVAFKTDLEGYQQAGTYTTPTDLETRLNSLSSELNNCYLSKAGSDTNIGIYTNYIMDSSREGGIRLRAPDISQFDATEYGYENIKVTRNRADNSQLFTFSDDINGNGIVRFKNLNEYIRKADVYNALSDITNDDVTFETVVSALINLKNITYTPPV